MRIVVDCMGGALFRELQLASVTAALKRVSIDVELVRNQTDIDLYPRDLDEVEDDDDDREDEEEGEETEETGEDVGDDE